jgi:dihydrodipicolinate synthase/N-acetylneuraminate lyase
MITTPLTPAHFHRSVMAVPPLARQADRSLCEDGNARVIRHLERGGVSLLLYGGNANFYHLPLSEYDAALGMLSRLASQHTLVVPSAGPTYALLLEQAKAIRRHAFPVVMVLPQRGVTTSVGVADGIREFADAAGVPVIVYVKDDGYIEPEEIAALDREGVVAAVKYAVVRTDTAHDSYLRKLVSMVDTAKIISGIGEQPAIVHTRDFGLGGFTSGCVCVAPRLSQAMLAAVRRRDWYEAERHQPHPRAAPGCRERGHRGHGSAAAAPQQRRRDARAGHRGCRAGAVGGRFGLNWQDRLSVGRAGWPRRADAADGHARRARPAQ